jgi:RNA polymerase primary sigma factor
MQTQDSGRAPDFLTRRPIQTREQQILLSRQIREWQDHPDGPDDAPKAIQRRGLRAQQQLVEGNMGLVLKMARGFCGRGVDYDDLVQVGAIGLMTAARKFDPSRGHAFSTYAVWWIRQALQRESRRGTTIALPLHTSELAYRALATASRLEGERGRAPTLQEVSIELENKWSADQLGTAVAALHRTRVRSLNCRPKEQEDASELIDLVTIADEVQAWDQVIAQEERQQLLVCLQQMEPATAQDLMAVYGHGKTLRAVAEETGVSREAVRQRMEKGKRQVRLRLLGSPLPSGQSRPGHGAPGRATAAA